MQYPKKVMKLTELVKEMGFPEEYLQRAYRLPTQRFAGKMNPMKNLIQKSLKSGDCVR